MDKISKFWHGDIKMAFLKIWKMKMILFASLEAKSLVQNAMAR
jgi:hypothetical protein